MVSFRLSSELSRMLAPTAAGSNVPMIIERVGKLQAEIFGTNAMDQTTIKDEADERMEKLESSV